MRNRKQKPKFAPRGPQHQRPKSWSKRQETQDPRRQRKRGKTVFLDDVCYFQPA